MRRQQGAGDRGQGRGEAAQPRGSLPRRGEPRRASRCVMRAKRVAMVSCLLARAPVTAALTGRFACQAVAGAGARVPFFTRPRARGRSTHSQHGRRRAAGQTSPALRARRVRSARRRQPVLSRIRSRCERTVRMLMYSSGDLRVGAAPGDQGDQFPFPGAERPRPVPPAAAGRGRSASGRTRPRWPGSSPRRAARPRGHGPGRAPAGPGAGRPPGGGPPRSCPRPRLADLSVSWRPMR